jgi:hypothetical protein
MTQKKPKSTPKKILKKPVTDNSQKKLFDLPEKKIIVTKQGLVEVDVKKQKESKTKFDFVKVTQNDPIEKCREIGERVFKKEIRFSHFTTENNIGVRYYLVLTNNK